MSTATSAPLIVATRLRNGSASSRRGAARLVANAIKTARAAAVRGVRWCVETGSPVGSEGSRKVEDSVIAKGAVAISYGAAAIQGVYGETDVNDYFIDHSEPAAPTGECWNWYHFSPRDDAQPKKVYIRVGGL